MGLSGTRLHRGPTLLEATSVLRGVIVKSLLRRPVLRVTGLTQLPGCICFRAILFRSHCFLAFRKEEGMAVHPFVLRIWCCKNLVLLLTETHAGKWRKTENPDVAESRHGDHDPGEESVMYFRICHMKQLAISVVLNYSDGMEYQSALYSDYILSHGAYLRGFIQNENTNLMSTKFNKQIGRAHV